MTIGIRYAGEPGVGKFTGARGRFAPIHQIVLADAGTNLTATANGTGVEVGECGTACLTLTVSAHTAGGDTMDVTIQTSSDNGATDAWRTVASFAQNTDVGSERKSFSGLDRWVRYRAVLAGAGVDVTFGISGDLK
jgi:hypothetical protein